MWSLRHNFGQIWYNVVKNQETGISVTNGVFYILHEVYIFIEIPEWKLKAKLARNTIYEGNWDEIFAQFGSKIAKSSYIGGFYFS